MKRKHSFNFICGCALLLLTVLLIAGGLFLSPYGPEEMDAAYRGCQYGLLLREDSAVNTVACPTKLLEYVSHGIVPVLRSEKIGDIRELGLGYVREADLMEGRLPLEAERLALAEQNAAILREETTGAIHWAKDLLSTT